MEKRAKKKKAVSRADAAPVPFVIIKPPSKAFFDRLAPPAKIAVPEAARITKEEAVNEIREYALAWSKAMENALGLPKKLFRTLTGTSLCFCSDDKAELGNAIEAIAKGTISGRVSNYGVIIHSPSSTTRLILIDMKRRIIVRDVLGCLHERPRQREWSSLAEAIREAADFAGKIGKDSVAVYDEGSIRAVRIAK